MERKIGEIFEYNGEWYQCVDWDVNPCSKCDFDGKGICSDEFPCTSSQRKDKKYVFFKKLEKVGETYEKRVSDGTFSTFQRYKVYNSVILPKKPYMYCNFIDNTIEIEIKQNKEDMSNTETLWYGPDKKEAKNLKLSNLKPFSLEAAKAGKPVCTRDGRKARIICFDLKNDEYPIVAAVENDSSETLFPYTTNGEIADGIESDKDLMMLPEKKEGWVNVYKDGLLGTRIHNMKKEAFDNASPKDYVATVKIEWEE